MGVLTHLDGFRDSKALKKTKKALKHRFWTEIYQGGCGGGAGRGGGGVGAGLGDHLLGGNCGGAADGGYVCSPPLVPPSLPPLPAAGAKLFYLSGVRNGKYMKREVHNLGE